MYDLYQAENSSGLRVKAENSIVAILFDSGPVQKAAVGSQCKGNTVIHATATNQVGLGDYVEVQALHVSMDSKKSFHKVLGGIDLMTLLCG